MKSPGADFRGLKGYKKAKYVFVDGLNYANFKNFLIQKGGKWIGEFKLQPEEYYYIFIVDGIRVLDSNNSDIVKDNGLDYNRIFVKNQTAGNTNNKVISLSRFFKIFL